MSDVVHHIKTNADKLVMAAEELKNASLAANAAQVAMNRATERLSAARKAYDECDKAVREEANAMLSKQLPEESV